MIDHLENVFQTMIRPKIEPYLTKYFSEIGHPELTAETLANVRRDVVAYKPDDGSSRLDKSRPDSERQE